MLRKFLALSAAFAAIAVAACGNRYNGSANNGTTVLPGMPDIAITATRPDGTPVVPLRPHHHHKKKTIGEELPSEGLGTIDDTFWKATLGGFTQQKFSQALGYPPGTKITLTNLSKSIEHTLDYVAKIKGPPAKFPANPKLPVSPQGNGMFEKGYASGPLSPGKSVTFTLAKAGIYLIGCAFHYSEGMHTVLVVEPGATPGPQATAPAR